MKPRKRFGQHFLCDQPIIERILNALQPATADHLIEIGPGQGALTIPLLRRGFAIEAIEIDLDCIEELRNRSRDSRLLHIHSQDVLQANFQQFYLRTKKPLRIFGNLPYNISTPLLFHLLNYAECIRDMLFMLQKEVAVRIAAKPDNKDYGRLSVMMQYHYQADILFHVAPTAFYPPPKVQSSIIRLIPYATIPYPAKDYKLFADVVLHAFNQRRKTLRNSLQTLVSDAVWQTLTVDKTARAENLTVQDFVTIANALSG